LIQFADIEGASSAKEALDGKSIPRQAIILHFLFNLFFIFIVN